MALNFKNAISCEPHAFYFDRWFIGIRSVDILQLENNKKGTNPMIERKHYARCFCQYDDYHPTKVQSSACNNDWATVFLHLVGLHRSVDQLINF